MLLLLLLLGLSAAAAAAAANNRCAVVTSAVCVETFVYFMCVCRPPALEYVNAQLPRHGVTKRTIGGSLAGSWPPPLPRRRRCCVLLLLMLGLSAAATNDRCAILDSAVCEFCLLCVCVLTYVWSFLA